MGERLLCKQEVDGSIPFTSTRLGPGLRRAALFRGAPGGAGCFGSERMEAGFAGSLGKRPGDWRVH